MEEVINGILIREVETKNIMTKSSLPVGGYSVNPYVGCTHACKYCYASFMKRFTGHTEEWGTFLDVKHWPEIKNPKKYAGQRVVIGSVTDGYNPQEEQFGNTRKLLEQLIGSDADILICTKSDLVVRDIDLLKKLGRVTVSWSINTLDENFKNDMDSASSIEHRIALESDLLSAAMLGIDNILCLTGDHTKMGDHPQAKPVFDLDSVSLLHTVKLLESGVDLGGNELVGEPPKFSKGAVVSPCSDSVDAQLAKMERKVAAGAEYFQTQAVFEPEKFIKFMEKAKQFGKPVQVGIIIPKSAGMAKFMNNNVAGIHVPDEMIEELKADKEKTKAGITGVEIAARIIKECKPYCQGVHIMALGWESKIPELLKLAEI